MIFFDPQALWEGNSKNFGQKNFGLNCRSQTKMARGVTGQEFPQLCGIAKSRILILLSALAASVPLTACGALLPQKQRFSTVAR